MQMRYFYVAIIVIGLLVAAAFGLADFARQSDDQGIGSAQLLGIQCGVALVMAGIGFLSVKREGRILTGSLARHIYEWISDAPPAFWVLATFLVLYLIFFISPVFFEKQKIHYFVKYIPYEWVTQIGFDISWTVNDIQSWLLDKESTYTLYAPLTTVLFSPLILLGFPGYYKLIVVITVISFCVATLLVPMLMRSRENYALIFLFFAVGLFSYGLQFELDRGQFNIIAFGASMAAIYIFHFHKAYRFFAYVLFSISIHLKLYPAIFIVLFIDDWRAWKVNIRRMAGLGMANFLLLFVLGYKPFIDFFQNMSSIQLSFGSSRAEDLSIKGFVYNLTQDGFNLLQPSQVAVLAKFSGLIELFFLLLFGVCLLSIIVTAYVKQQRGLNPYLLAVCTIGALIIPSMSFDYKLPMLIAPMVILLSNLPDSGQRNKKGMVIFLLIIISTAFWSTFYPFTIKPYILSRNFLALITLLLAITGLYFLHPYTILDVIHQQIVPDLETKASTDRSAH